jgi:quinol monooxygenase YgiN
MGLPFFKEESKMLVVLANITTKPGQRSEAIKASLDCIKATREENGCILYELFASAEDETSLVFVEKWTDKDALRAHLQTEHLKNSSKARAPYVDGEIKVNVFEAEQTKL